VLTIALNKLRPSSLLDKLIFVAMPPVKETAYKIDTRTVQKMASVSGVVYRRGMPMAGKLRMETIFSPVHNLTWSPLLATLEVENLPDHKMKRITWCN
jgi:hypothetical protein